jgi:predicted PurR-regulated permease PerM
MPPKKSSINRYFIVALVLLLFTLVAYLARSLFGPLIIASLIAYLLKPLVSLLTSRFRIKQDIAVILVYFAFLAVLLGTAIGLTPILVRQAQSLTHAVQDFAARLEALLAEPIWIAGIPIELADAYADLRATSAQFFSPDQIFTIIKAATTNIAWILVIFVTSFHLLRDWEKLRDWIYNLAPSSYRSDVIQLHSEIKLIWGGYLRGQMLLMLVIGLLSTATSFAIGLPDAILIGLIAGGLDFIPTLGPAAATALAALIAWTEGSLFLPISAPWFVVLIILLFQLIQLAESVWLQPRILGHRLHLHRGVVFVAVISALTLGSILLALIIVPLIASLGVIGRYVHRKILGVV